MISKEILDAPLGELGLFTPLSLNRLASQGIKTLRDLITREEYITLSSLQPGSRPNRYRPIELIGLPSHVDSCIRSKGHRTVADVLEKPFNEALGRNKGLTLHLMIRLIDLGYTEMDGPFLSQHEFAERVLDLRLYKILVNLDEKGSLSGRFKEWFNKAIEGRVYHTDNRPTRKGQITPFA